MALDFTAMMQQGGGTDMSALTGLSNILNGAAAKPMTMSAPNAGLPKVKGIGNVAAPKAAAAIDPTTFRALAAILQGGR